MSVLTYIDGVEKARQIEKRKYKKIKYDHMKCVDCGYDIYYRAMRCPICSGNLKLLNKPEE